MIEMTKNMDLLKGMKGFIVRTEQKSSNEEIVVVILTFENNIENVDKAHRKFIIVIMGVDFGNYSQWKSLYKKKLVNKMSS